jgi:mono/diheme cytochrome c family protein
MHHHYLEVGEIHEAVIRGDLAAVRGPSERLRAALVVPAVPPTLSPFIATMTNAARRANEAGNLTAAAVATTELIAQCAGCHQAAGVRPAVIGRPSPDVGGLVGHMLDHQRATDALLHGLLLPSTVEWERGAALLRKAELHRLDLPPDPEMSREVRQAETRVHAMADEAMAARTAARREAVYARLMTTCAECHGLHPTVWGPRTQDR